MRVKRAKKLLRRTDEAESSSPGLFILLIATVVFVAGITGAIVFSSSHDKKESVERQSQLYEQAKNQLNEPSASKTDDSSSSQAEALVADGGDPTVASTALIYFSKYPDSNSNDNQLISVQRDIYQGQDPVASVVKELISGPSSAEKAEGFFGGIKLTGDSNCDNQDFKIITDESSIKLQFCREYSGGGVTEYEFQQEQIIKSLSGISGQLNVFVLDRSGKCLFNQSLASC